MISITLKKLYWDIWKTLGKLCQRQEYRRYKNDFIRCFCILQNFHVDRRCCYRLKINYEEREERGPQLPSGSRSLGMWRASWAMLKAFSRFSRMESSSACFMSTRLVDGLDHSQESQPAPPAACKSCTATPYLKGKQQPQGRWVTGLRMPSWPPEGGWSCWPGED